MAKLVATLRRALRALWQVLSGIYYSLPVQLVILLLARHKFVLFFWLVLILIAQGNLLESMGARTAFLEPEYLGQVGFWSMFITGAALGLFILAYQMAIYILDGHIFSFLALERRPFVKFAQNNSLVPVLFWVIFAQEFWRFHHASPTADSGEIAHNLGAVLLGAVVVSVVAVTYFYFTNKDALRLLGEKVVRELRNPRVLVREARRSIASDTRVDWYLGEWFRPSQPDKNLRGDVRKLVEVLNQNHANALIFMLLILLALLGISWLEGVPEARIPVAASILLVFAFVMMALGAAVFWFRRLGLLTFLLLASAFFFLNTYQPFVGTNHGFGLDYQKEPMPYTQAVIDSLAQPRFITEDSLHGLQILDNWKRRWQAEHGPGTKPKLVLLGVSGGGMRSAVFVMQALQQGMERTQGLLAPQLQFISGASGGMLGAAYFRELMLYQQQNPSLRITHRRYLDNVGKDLMNPIFFGFISNVFLPFRTFEDENGDGVYNKERGYAFEQQLIDNTGAFANKRIADYREAEFSGRIPMLLISPTVVNDGRQLLISPQPLSYLARARCLGTSYCNEVPAVDMGRLLAQHKGDRLYMTSALRMNATFPSILPAVELPTEPRTEVIDAGVYDNFGIMAISRYLINYREWIARNTRGVVVLLIRDSKRESEIEPPGEKTLLNKALGIFGTTYLSFAEGKDFDNDRILALTRELLPAPMDVVELQYIPTQVFREAALSFHLSTPEKMDVLESIYSRENQQALEALGRLLAPSRLRKPTQPASPPAVENLSK